MAMAERFPARGITRLLHRDLDLNRIRCGDFCVCLSNILLVYATFIMFSSMTMYLRGSFHVKILSQKVSKTRAGIRGKGSQRQLARRGSPNIM